MIEKNSFLDPVRSVKPIRQEPLSKGVTARRTDFGADFETLLKEQLEKNQAEKNQTETKPAGADSNTALQFSKHARERALQRGIQLTDDLRSSLENAVDKARAKGARDVAVIDAKQVFIVNIPNNTVVTAISEPELQDSVFTNIDSAVIL